MEKMPVSQSENPEKSPHILKFDSWGDFLNNSKEAGHLKKRHVTDIEVGGTPLSTIEKNHIQQQSVAMASAYLAEHLKVIGVTDRVLDPKRITFVEYYSAMEGGHYSTENDWVTIPTYNEGNVGVIVHESIHALSSEWQYRAHEYLDSLSQGRDIKTGFSSISSKSRPSRTVFDLLNEAITEKMAREITQPRTQGIEALNKNSNRGAYHLDSIENKKREKMEEARKIVENTIKGIPIKEQERIDALKKRHGEYVKETVHDWTKIGMPQEVIDDFVKERDEWINKEIEMEKRFASMDYGNAKAPLELEEAKWNDIKHIAEDSLNRPTLHAAYQTYIDILDIILTGLARTEAAQSGRLESEVQKELWRDIQRAYFNGNVMWLRKIERVFGKGTLELIGTLPPPTYEFLLKKDISGEVKKTLQAAIMDMSGGVKKEDPAILTQSGV